MHPHWDSKETEPRQSPGSSQFPKGSYRNRENPILTCNCPGLVEAGEKHFANVSKHAPPEVSLPADLELEQFKRELRLKQNKQTKTQNTKTVSSGDTPIASYRAKCQILLLKLWPERAKD